MRGRPWPGSSLASKAEVINTDDTNYGRASFLPGDKPGMDMPQVLSIVHQRLREALSVVPAYRAESATSDSLERNPKGDLCQGFDLVADTLIHEELKTLGPSGIVHSEERVDETVFGKTRG